VRESLRVTDNTENKSPVDLKSTWKNDLGDLGDAASINYTVSALVAQGAQQHSHLSNTLLYNFANVYPRHS
jgi:hypothetical protein